MKLISTKFSGLKFLVARLTWTIEGHSENYF